MLDLNYLACLHEVTLHVSRKVEFLFWDQFIADVQGTVGLVLLEVLGSLTGGLLDFPRGEARKNRRICYTVLRRTGT